MGYLNNQVVTIDAILTKKGRELLARGDGSFNITQFALADDEIDYTLYNTSHPSGTLEVQLDKQIPTASINLDHFVIRRYVPDGSFILFNESKPSGNTGPSLIKPQFVTQTLTKGVDEYIVDLTSKGLIPQ